MKLPVAVSTAALMALAVALTATSAATAVPISDTRTSIAVDCAVGEGSGDNQVLLPGETLTITLTSCDGATVTDLDATSNLYDSSSAQLNSFVVAGSPYVFTAQGAADLAVVLDAVYEIDIDVQVAEAAPTPTGALNLTSLVSLPTTLPTFEIDLDTIDMVAETFVDDALLGDDPSCNMEPGYHPYQTLAITVSESGDYTFRVIDVTPLDRSLQWGTPTYPSQDLFLAVYSAFDPLAPEEGLVGCNDDNDGPDGSIVVNGGTTYLYDDQAPAFVQTLAPGSYTIVVSTYGSISADNWTNGEFSPWSGSFGNVWDPQEMTALFELWGPVGSITAGAAPTLPSTGAADVLPLGVLAGLTLAVGLGAVLVARRVRA